VFKANAQDNEQLRAALSGTWDNHELRETQGYADLVRDVVVDETFSEDFRSEILATLDDVKYESAKAALTEVAGKVSSERLKATATRTLAANFPAPPPPAKDPKGGKKK
ncbi:MAG TPA: hypothetical protein VGD87_11105, partial [Archangium sp.]